MEPNKDLRRVRRMKVMRKALSSQKWLMRTGFLVKLLVASGFKS